MKEQLEYTKTRMVNNPSIGTKGSAGLDLFVPKFTRQFLSDFCNKNTSLSDYYSYQMLDTKEFILKPQKRILIPSGIHFKLPVNTVLIGFNKSGVSTKKGLDMLACVIDEDYQGEVHISLLNTSDEVVRIKEDEKIAQYVLLPRIHFDFLIHPSTTSLYKNAKSERKENGFGSTNK